MFVQTNQSILITMKSDEIIRLLLDRIQKADPTEAIKAPDVLEDVKRYIARIQKASSKAICDPNH